MPAHIQVRRSCVPTPQRVHFKQAFPQLGTSLGLQSPGHIFSAFVSDVFNMNYSPQRDTAWMLALVFKKHLVCS